MFVRCGHTTYVGKFERRVDYSSCLQIGIPGMLLGVITYYAKEGVRAV